MPVPTIVLDGTQPYGSFTATIGGKGPFIFDSFAVDRPTTVAEDRDEMGGPQRWRATVGFDTATAVVQALGNVNDMPQFGGTIDALIVDGNYGAEQWCVMNVPVELSNDPSVIRKLNLTFRKVYNGITTVA